MTAAPFAFALCVVAAFAWDFGRRYVARHGATTSRDVQERLAKAELDITHIKATLDRPAPPRRVGLSGVNR